MANEKRLIDAEALRKNIESKIYWLTLDPVCALEEIDNAPTVDAEEVVRCGNCKHFREPFCIRRDDETHRERINMLTVDFCSYGKRKEG